METRESGQRLFWTLGSHALAVPPAARVIHLTRLLPNLGFALAAAALLALGAVGGHLLTGSGAQAAPTPRGLADVAATAHNQTAVIENGTIVAVSYLLIDEDGMPFYTNSYTTALAIAKANPEYVPKGRNFYATGPFQAGEDHILGATFSQSLVGHRLGDIIEVPYQTAAELGHAWEAGPTLQRHWGPFPLEETVDKEVFHRRINATEVGSTFRLNFRYNATLLSETDSTVTYRILVEDGVPRPIPEMQATLVATVHGDGTFSERVDIAPGTAFTRSNSRLFDLGPGSYRVLSVTDDAIAFEFSSLRNTELIGKGATIIVHVTEVYG